MKQGLLAVALVFAACGGDKDKKAADESAPAGEGAEASGAADMKLAAAADEAAGAADPAAAAADPPAGAAAAAARAAADPAGGGLPAGWVRFELKEDNFAIGLPRQPGAPELFDVPTDAGMSQGKVYMVVAAPYYYGLGVVTMPQAVLDEPEPMTADVVAAAFDGGVEQMVASVNGVKTGERDLEVLDLPAREITYTVSVQGQRVEGLARMIADPRTKKIYQLQVLSDRPVAAAAKPYFDSFEILSKK
jgi:hypothetical protein